MYAFPNLKITSIILKKDGLDEKHSDGRSKYYNEIPFIRHEAI